MTHRQLPEPEAELERINRHLVGHDAVGRVRYALEQLPGEQVLASSFGAQAAVTLHLVTRIRPDIPVVFIDTGYHFAETYRFVDELSERLRLNLRVYRPRLSSAWQEARYGRRWEQGREGIEAYNHDNKVEPMRRALDELGAGTWLSGIRRQQAASRTGTRPVETRNNRYKVHPLYDWTDRDVHRYLERHDLPYHPLWHQGYVSIGDWHTTRPIHEAVSAEDTRFFGIKRECGLHEAV